MQACSICVSARSRILLVAMLALAASVTSYVGQPLPRASKTRAVRMIASRPEFDMESQPGITAPLGFFDPVGFSSMASDGQAKFLREAEIKHGRVAMLASLGFVVGEQFHPMWGGQIDVPAAIAWQETPLENVNILVMLVVGIHEVISVFTFNSPFGGELWSIRSDYRSGDLGWDPLGLKPEDAAGLADMQTKEINNGRLAMIGIAGMVGQELASNNRLF